MIDQRHTWTPGALEHDRGGHDYYSKIYGGRPYEPVRDRALIIWTRRMRRAALEVMALPVPERDEPRPRAGELVPGSLWFGDDVDAVRVLEGGR